MEIIDAHLHLPRPWSQWKHGDEAFLDLQTELLLGQMDAAGVDAAVIISDPHVAPAQWCAAATARHPDRLATVLVCDETAPDIADQVASARENPGVLGLRITTAWPPGNVERLRAGAYDRLLSTAEERGVPVCVLGAGDMPDVAVVARAYPTLPLIIDHLGLNQPPFMPADDPPWRDLGQLLALADLPNVSVKLSGAPTLSDTPYPYPDIWPHLRQVLDAFGVDRCMWGTDQHRVFGRLHGFDPVPRYPGYHSYAQGLHYLLDRDEFSEAEKSALFGGTLRKIMGWPAVPASALAPSPTG
ncbi:amidohydrolase family protein [Streptomyces sp. GMR22]|uniref:amidohydrolase family protein n=1 Tax=Streptomyces sp. GMR22 TaxID=2759524 RepID=UPI0015FB8DB6|nr:amidohydrolase family protein [Streptomyces sp. GMR22]MBA6440864.1 amidohydrolase [Streptomyces sp. GMR22]